MSEPYTFVEYPKVLYKGQETSIVEDADAEKALGKGWGSIAPTPPEPGAPIAPPAEVE